MNRRQKKKQAKRRVSFANLTTLLTLTELRKFKRMKHADQVEFAFDKIHGIR
ncbi:MAG: hypothetical protein J6U37_01555 [Lachnospiraceae bacterium]|nr:hypothetical protein [Lachnospiraceae bacterium]